MAGLLTEPIAADRANRACRAGHLNYVRAASERIFIERRIVAPRSAKVAASLRRDEPCSTPLASIWPVDSHDAFTQSGLHRVLQTKDQRLVSTERDGYFGLCRITKSPSINLATRTNGTPVGGTASIGCVAKQREAQVSTLNSHGTLASRKESSLRLLVPAAHSHRVEVPPRGAKSLRSHARRLDGTELEN